jgi:hypothetical protein
LVKSLERIRREWTLAYHSNVNMSLAMCGSVHACSGLSVCLNERLGAPMRS